MSRNNSETDWRPSCDLSALRARADMLAKIRSFFAERNVLEVETPLLSPSTVTDPNLQPFVTEYRQPGKTAGITLYLQTSPEYAMKRLLAAGSGSIFQICKAFRNEESGRLHNPEFTLLEWYRVGFGLNELMDEIEALFEMLFHGARELAGSERIPYRQVFEAHVGIDPIESGLTDFVRCAKRHGLNDADTLCGAEPTIWLDYLFSELVQPHLGQGHVTCVYDYPACLPSLARRKPAEPEVVERMEVFVDGVELGNGFHELADAEEQENRFAADLKVRRRSEQFIPSIDQRLISALKSGIPDCSGIALGLDRVLLLTLKQDYRSLGSVITIIDR